MTGEAKTQTPAEKYDRPKPSCPWGQDGNAFAIISCVSKALRRAGYPREAIAEYQAESTRGDYSHVLETAWTWAEEGTDWMEEEEG
jgi:hypothetical protein